MKCPKCKQEVSPDADRCILCGSEIPKGFLHRWFGFKQQKEDIPGGLKIESTESPEFYFVVMDVFCIADKVAAVGRVESGTVYEGDMVNIISATGGAKTVRVIQIIKSGEKKAKYATAGDKIALYLLGISKKDINAKDIIRKLK